MMKLLLSVGCMVKLFAVGVVDRMEVEESRHVIECIRSIMFFSICLFVGESLSCLSLRLWSVWCLTRDESLCCRRGLWRSLLCWLVCLVSRRGLVLCLSVRWRRWSSVFSSVWGLRLFDLDLSCLRVWWGECRWSSLFSSVRGLRLLDLDLSCRRVWCGERVLSRRLCSCDLGREVLRRSCEGLSSCRKVQRSPWGQSFRLYQHIFVFEWVCLLLSSVCPLSMIF